MTFLYTYGFSVAKLPPRSAASFNKCWHLPRPTLKALRPLSLWLRGWGRAVICTLRLPGTWSRGPWVLRKESPESAGQLLRGSGFWSQCGSSPQGK